MSEFLFPFTTFSFAYPWMLLCPAVLLAGYIANRGKQDAISYPSAQPLQSLPVSWRIRARLPVLGPLLCVAILALSFAAARPQHVTTLPQQKESRNLMLALDISKSMGRRDFGGDYGRVTRLRAVKAVVSQFIEARRDDRIGLVAFGTGAFLQSPLTFDHQLVMQMVEGLSVGLAGAGTAVGDGLGLALKRVEKVEGESKAIILMTDGVSNSGQIENPLVAAKVAADLNVKVHTIGIGAAIRAPVRLPGGLTFGGQQRSTEFDEETLQRIAEITGGVYFDAHNIEGLKKVYDEIDRLERSEHEETAHRRVREYFVPYALLGFLSYALYLILAKTLFLRIP